MARVHGCVVTVVVFAIRLLCNLAQQHVMKCKCKHYIHVSIKHCNEAMKASYLRQIIIVLLCSALMLILIVMRPVDNGTLTDDDDVDDNDDDDDSDEVLAAEAAAAASELTTFDATTSVNPCILSSLILLY